MILIDTVYQKVLAIANKEQRGYITPQEFNLFADQAQLEIFEQYFYDLSQFSRRPGDDYSEATSSRYVQAIENFPGLKNHVRVGGADKDLILINMPYIDLRAEGFDLELFKKIGLPQFKKGGKTKNDMGDPLIDIEIFMKSV